VKLLDDLQNREAIVFRDRFFDSTGQQIQDMQVSRDHLPATVLMANAINTNKDLDDLLCQGDIPRLLNQELKERNQLKKSVEPLAKVGSSSSAKTNTRSGFDGISDAYDPDAYDPSSGSSRGEKCKDGHSDTPFAFSHVNARVISYA
jgi:hypothetical protein